MKLKGEIMYKKMLKEREGWAGLGKGLFEGRIPQDLKNVLEGIFEDLKDIIEKLDRFDGLSTQMISLRNEIKSLKENIDKMNEKIERYRDDMIKYTNERVDKVTSLIQEEKHHKETTNFSKKHLYILVGGIIVSTIISIISLVKSFLL